MSEKLINITAFILLGVMFIMGFLSYREDSATMDELSHIPAGFSYVSQQDFRINPEHPPLIKDLAALPLLLLNLNFPSQSLAWQEGINNQWFYGWEFLYNSGNNPDQILLLARLPMLLVLVFLGAFLFWWTKKEFGKKVALLVLILFVFSPTLLAHGRLVTTDVGATLGFVLGLYFWLKFLKKPSLKNIFWAGLIFGIAMCFKFSVVLLIPFFAFITVVYVLLHKKNLFRYLGLSVLIGIIGALFIILPLYQLHVANYPVPRQLADTINLLESSPMKQLKGLCVWMADKPILRSLGHYLLGLLMATQRTAFGNTVYFMGMISAAGWWYYFPIVYFLKTPLALSILTLMALLLTAGFVEKPFWANPIKRVQEWLKGHFTEFSMLVFLAIYWATSIAGNLNIGVRHVLPVLPFTYILVSLGLILGIGKIKRAPLRKGAWALAFLLLFWYAGSSIRSFPHFLSHFNELGGGLDNGYQYAVDSNYDWGQDLKRLALWVKDNNIEKIKVDYFGGGDVNYYLGQKGEKISSYSGPHEGWIAVSVTLLQGGMGNPVPGFDQPAGFYKWLAQYQPKARAGKSIFIYYIE